MVGLRIARTTLQKFGEMFFDQKRMSRFIFQAGEEVVHRHRLPQHLRLPEDQEEAQAAGPGVNFITLF